MLTRRLPLALLAPVLVAAPAVPAAAAPLARVPLPLTGEVVPSSFLVRGPVLAGDTVVFGASAGTGTPARMLAVPAAGGPVRELPGPWSRLSGGGAGILARSEVVTAGGEDRNRPAYTARETLMAGPVDGPAQTLGTCIAPVAADGARVAYATGDHCDVIAVRDLVADREIARWPAGDGARLTATDAGFRLAGDRVAWNVDAPGGTSSVMVADAVTGVARREPKPTDTRSYALARDGTLAFLRNTGFQEDWKHRIVLRAPGGADREIAAWSAWGTGISLLAFSGDELVVGLRQQARAVEHRAAADRLLALAPDGAVRTLLRARPPAEVDHAHPGQELVGVDVEDGRIAWMLRDCDEAAVGAAAIADLPAGGIDATAPEHCPRPILERTTLRLDRLARTTVAVRCPAACSGTLTLTGRSSSGSEYAVHPLAQRPFSLAAGRHRLRVLVTDEDRAWVARGVRHARPAQLALVGTTGTRPSSRLATMQVIADKS
ncbi:MAG TPA: hypothetical protein VK501_22305 [Baekduia sp.]|uniref:hypothetical protein n=1 Tax=Baekduia sp. TaxID=2600305 RepID=UPI002C6F2F58|nr:hypothetical protein [Baekduia sp.]HMJ36654.1 hypothetical protein [Baekduia sp.]